MKWLVLLGLLTTALAFAQRPQGINVQGRDMNQDGAVVKARGNATITNGTVRIQADSIIYNRETGEAEATGNVRIKFVTAESANVPVRMNPTPTLEERFKQMKRRFPPEIRAH